MGNTSFRESTDLKHEVALQLIGSLNAGLRVILEATLTVPGNDQATYTVADIETRRIVVQPAPGGADGDIRLAPPNETADADSFPLMAAATPMVLWVGEDDVISFYNDTGAAIDVTIWECR